MNKKAFTLIELLAVVTLIGLLSVLIIPKITENINNKKSEINEANMKLLASATDIYIERNPNEYTSTYEANGSTYCIPVQSLINQGVITKPYMDSTGKEIDYTKQVKAKYEAYYNNFSYELVDECTEVIQYVNRPALSKNMIPVIYDENKGIWVKADQASKWYNYSEQKWANAVLVKENKSSENSKSRYEYNEAPSGTEILESDILAYFVWIPRFKYQLFSSNEQSINIVFESISTPKSKGTSTGDWLTHPAFTTNNQELTGIWVAKYESSNQDDNIIIKKDQTPWTNIGYNKANAKATEMTNQNNIYGLTNINTHLIQNKEWGAVAYLTNSQYGINLKINASTNKQTGNSTSTTGNITGIFDMSGVSSEFVRFQNETEDTLGSALSETKSFYSDTNTFTTEEKPYLIRGKTSIFNYSNTNISSNDISFRVSLINGDISLDNGVVCVAFDDNIAWSDIITAIQNNNISCMEVGDTKKVTLTGEGDLGGTYTLRIANLSTPEECKNKDFSQTACGFVLEFADIITTHVMNDSATNVGGWQSSKMRKYLNCSTNGTTQDGSLNCSSMDENTIYDSLPDEIKNAIIPTKVISGHGSSENNNFETTDLLYLLSRREVWNFENSYDKAYALTRQLDYYKINNVTTGSYEAAKKYNYKVSSTNASEWWLRSAFSIVNTAFNYATDTGSDTSSDANCSYGVAPAFRIG